MSYGLIAAELPDDIRVDIKASSSALAQDCAARLQREYDFRKDRFRNQSDEIGLTPDLQARFERELPDLFSTDAMPATEERG